jgi:serine/threonine protein phosphatase 1
MLLEAYFKYKANSGYPDGVCLHSFGVDYAWKIPEKYILFFQSLPFYIVTDNYILVHAGLNFDGQDPFSDTNAMAWLGYWYDSIDRNWLNGKIILHGHTPQSKQNIEKMFKRLDFLPALNLDCRAFHSKQDPSKYALCGFDMTNQKLYFQF